MESVPQWLLAAVAAAGVTAYAEGLEAAKAQPLALDPSTSAQESGTVG